MEPSDPTKPLQPKVVLGIAAHPDDLDFGASAAVATFIAQGASVSYLQLTDGSKGSEDRAMTPERLAAMRRDEQRAAGKVLGLQDVYFLSNPDGYLEVTMQLKKDIVRVIRQVRPDTVICWDPTVSYSLELGFVNHPDHRAAGQATLDALFPLARDHMSFPELLAEGLEPHKVSTALMMNLNTSNYYVDVTDTLDTKFAVLAEHASQVGDMAAVRQRFTERAEAQGKAAGVRYAEGFVRLELPA